MKLKELVSFLLGLLFPPHCVFCGKVIAPGTKVCAGCAAQVSPAGGVRCMNLPGSGKNIRCAVLYSYEGEVRRSVIRFKFYGEKKYADFYAEKLAELVGKSFQPAADLVTAVPISKERQRSRGFNQSELLARGIARELDLPYADCLEKIRDNPEQHRLKRQDRLRNVRGVYRTLPGGAEGKRVLLVDDIVTTGSTLCECAAELFRGGARSVDCAAVAQVGREPS